MGLARPLGKAWIEDNVWHIDGEPHLIMQLKRVFGRIWKGDQGKVTISHTDEVARNLEWFFGRFTVEMAPRDKAIMLAASKIHKETIQRLEDMIDQKYKPRAFPMAIPPRDYQRRAAEVYLTRGFLLCGDDVGLGKTATAICSLTDRRTLPAVVVTLAGTMPEQWAEEIQRFIPKLFVHVIEKMNPYELPKQNEQGPDVVVLNYHKLSRWSQILAEYARSVVYDECQELRRREKSQKYAAAVYIARKMKYRIGLSATPVYNLGGEIWNVADVLCEGVLGSKLEFDREWCVSSGRGSRVVDPKALGSYMREHFIMLRRTRHEVGRELPALTKIPQHVLTNHAALDKIKDSAAELAKIILAQTETSRGDKMRASEELSNTLRQATGIAKSPYVADFIRLLVDSGEKVLVYAWHREVYSILQAKLRDLNPVMFTGSESTAAKAESKRRFMLKEGDEKSDIMLMSLRAGAGVDGLQKCCRTVVFAELDWSPGCHEQCIGRIYRDGQPDPVTVYFLVAKDGADPVIAETLGIKREQIEGIRDPKHGLLEDLQTDPNRARQLAEYYLKKIGVPLPVPKPTPAVEVQMKSVAVPIAPPVQHQKIKLAK